MPDREGEEGRRGAHAPRVPTLSRTVVILMAQVVVIVVLVVLWSVLRGRRSDN